MRTDAASILIAMGKVVDVDFVASQTAPNNVTIKWLTQPEITEAEIDAFALANPNAYQIFVEQQKGKQIGTFHVVRKGANQATSSTAFSDVTGLTFNLAPNTHYRFRFLGAYTAAAATTGLQLSVNGPASPDFMRFIGSISTSATASFNGAIGTYDGPLSATASGGATVLPFWIEGTISTGSAGGPFTLRFRSEINASAVTILQGSFAELAAAN